MSAIQPRFSKDDGCLGNAMDIICKQIGLQVADERVAQDRSIEAVCDWFCDFGCEVKINIRLPYCISPWLWSVQYRRSASRAHILSSLRSRSESTALLVHGTAWQLYRIPEAWTHYIVAYYVHDRLVLDDVIIEDIRSDYNLMPQSDTDVEQTLLRAATIVSICR